MTDISSSPSTAYIWRTSQHQQIPIFAFQKCGYIDSIARRCNIRTVVFDNTKIKYTVMRCPLQSSSKPSTTQYKYKQPLVYPYFVTAADTTVAWLLMCRQNNLLIYKIST